MDTVLFNIFNSIETFIKSINKFFYSALVKSFLSVIIIIISYTIFTKGYSFLIYFVLNIISSTIILIFILFLTFKILSKYKK